MINYAPEFFSLRQRWVSLRPDVLLCLAGIEDFQQTKEVSAYSLTFLVGVWIRIFPSPLLKSHLEFDRSPALKCESVASKFQLNNF